MTWVKICGTTNSHDAGLAVEAGADALGFVFAPSARRVTPEIAREIVEGLPRGIEKVGVFVNESPERVLETIDEVGLTGVQLHGDEGSKYVQEIRSNLGTDKGRIRVLKAVAVRPGFRTLLDQFLEQGLIEGVLLDSGPPSAKSPRGGTGKIFDWDLASDNLGLLRDRVAVVIGGGLSPQNVGDAISKLRPWGVDVASGVEREPGRKDPEKLKAFVAAVRAAAEQG